MKHLDLFSGIGGFALAAQMTGDFETVAFCEIDLYCQKVLNKNFPGIPIYDDIKTLTAETLGERSIRAIDVITGGFPCQDISCANPNGRGLEGERSGLFFELMRVVRECRPRYVVLENVAEMLRKQQGRIMGTVLWELFQSGYHAEWQIVSAASVGAPHTRERVFIVAYTDSSAESIWRQQQHKKSETVRAATNGRRQRRNPRVCFSPAMELKQAKTLDRFCEAWASGQNPWAAEPGVLRVANGISNRVDRIRGCGNAIVPQCGAIALQRVLELEQIASVA